MISAQIKDGEKNRRDIEVWSGDDIIAEQPMHYDKINSIFKDLNFPIYGIWSHSKLGKVIYFLINVMFI